MLNCIQNAGDSFDLYVILAWIVFEMQWILWIVCLIDAFKSILGQSSEEIRYGNCLKIESNHGDF